MHGRRLAHCRNGVGPSCCSAWTPTVYSPVSTEVSDRERSGVAASSDAVFVRRHSDTAVAFPSTSGDCDMPKYIVPPCAGTKSAGSMLTGCSV